MLDYSLLYCSSRLNRFGNVDIILMRVWLFHENGKEEEQVVDIHRTAALILSWWPAVREAKRQTTNGRQRFRPLSFLMPAHQAISCHGFWRGTRHTCP
jgi:hypothetical protein